MQIPATTAFNVPQPVKPVRIAQLASHAVHLASIRFTIIVTATVHALLVTTTLQTLAWHVIQVIVKHALDPQIHALHATLDQAFLSYKGLIAFLNVKMVM